MQRDNFAEFRRKRIHCLLENAPLFVLLGRFVLWRNGVARFQRQMFDTASPSGSSLSPHIISRDVQRYSVHPRLESLAAAKLSASLDNPDPRFLEQVLSS